MLPALPVQAKVILWLPVYNAFNDECHKHIITLEDPIEFTFENNQSLIHQRQLGQDMESMAAGVSRCVTRRSGCNYDW
mgnify:CR=1 FL=1